MADPPQREDRQPTGRPAPGGRIGKDFAVRLLSGIALAATALALTYWGLLPFAAMVLAVAAVVAWEWGRIVRGVEFDVTTLAHVVAVVAAVGLAAMDLVGLALLAILIGATLVSLLAMGRHPAVSALGVLFAGLPAVALVWLRADHAFGLLAVLFVMTIVVVTDTAAYVSGRLIGGPRLLPRVSPNKTWAGLVGAVLASAVAGFLYAYAVVGANPMRLALLGAAIAVVAQAGDLGESALKRRFGAKDASNVIPGHGGFMDRVDGLVTAAVFAAILAAIVDIQQPARALLLW